MNRRALLGSLGSLATAGLAGCLDDSPSLEPAATLGRLSVSNRDDGSAHTFGLRVERGGTVVHESSHTVERATEPRIPGVVVDCTWDGVAGTYTVHARVDGGEWNRVDRRERTVDLRDETDRSPECVAVDVQYEPGATASEPWYVLVHGCDDYWDRCDWADGQTERTERWAVTDSGR